MLEVFLSKSSNSAEFAARWWACLIDNPYFEQGRIAPYNSLMPPIDEPSAEELAKFANELTVLIHDELNKTWNKESHVYNETGAHEMVPTPMHILLWSENGTPCELMDLATKNAEMFIPWWAWPSGIRMRVSRFHVEIQRGNISPWETKWGERPESIGPAKVQNSLQHVRGLFGIELDEEQIPPDPSYS